MEAPIREYDVNETIKLNALFLTGATVGSILQGQTLLLVRDTADLDLSNGAPIIVVGAGEVGGDLVTTVVSASGQRVILAAAAGQDVRLAPVGNPGTPTTVTCKVRHPDGSEETCATTNPSPGRYRATVTPSVDGDFFYRFTGTGTASADRWRKFRVRPERVA